MSTWNDSSFTTDLMVLVFLASILIAYNIRFIRIFCQPVYLVSSIPNIDQYILYLRPFETDNTSFEGFIKYISDKSYKAIAIANPHMVVQNVESDKIYGRRMEGCCTSMYAKIQIQHSPYRQYRWMSVGIATVYG